jgi:aspartyl protease family protein
MLRFAFTSLVLVVAGSLLFSLMLHGQLAMPVMRTAAQAPALEPVAVPQAASPLQANNGNQSLDTIEIAPDPAGNFLTDIDIDGQVIHVIVDTGASYLSLSSEDADALGINLAPADFRYRFSTANGVAAAAKVHLNAVRIANIEIDDVDAFVSQPGALRRSLLGMNVLSRLGGIHISDGRLVLQR